MSPTSEPRLDVLKTYKLFINGQFPRSESGRTLPIKGPDASIIAHASHASRKDLRDAVLAARAGLAKWSSATAYNRGQVLYRLAEMLQTRRDEFVHLARLDPTRLSGADALTPAQEVDAAVDRLVYYAGFTDKIAQVLGSANAVNGPYWNITQPQPVGVLALALPADAPALLALISLLAPALAAGNAAVVLSAAFAPTVSTLGEAIATSDLPPGTCNLLTAPLEELAPIAAKHRDIDGLLSITTPATAALITTLREGVAENLKRVHVFDPAPFTDTAAWHSLRCLEPCVEYKTVWHPVGT